MLCPICAHDNIEGADVCEECQSDLTAIIAEPLDPVERRFNSDRARKLIGQAPLTVAPTDPLGLVVQQMSQAGRNCALVVFDGVLVGIFTERDALKKVSLEYAHLKNQPVRDFMTAAPETLTADSSLAFILNKMAVGGYRHVPIVDEKEQPLGVTAVKEVLAHLVNTMPESFGT